MPIHKTAVIRTRIAFNNIVRYYNNIVYGYEYYVIDGTHMVRVEQNLRYKLFSYHKSFFKILKNEPRIKFKLDASALVNVSPPYVKEKKKDNIFFRIVDSFSENNLKSVKNELKSEFFEQPILQYKFVY